MAMTIVVTRDIEDRYRGFLLSCMPEVAPGVYVSPNLSKAARERVWEVMKRWHATLSRGSVTLIHADRGEPSGLSVQSVGSPRRELVDFDGVLGVRIHAGRDR